MKKITMCWMILLLMLSLAACLPAASVPSVSGKQSGAEPNPGQKSDPENDGRRSESGGLTIVTDFDPQSGAAPDVAAEEPEEIFRRIYRYAEYTDSGVRLMYWDVNFQSGRLLYCVSNPRVSHSLEEMDGDANCFSRSFSQHGEQGEDLPPKWILPDGSFEDHALLLVDVSVTNDNASLKSGIDKFEKEIDPYLFPADGLLFLHNGSRKQPREKANCCSIDYFSLKRSDLDYAFSFQLSPGETVNFTIGFVLGKPGLFDTADGLYLCNTMSADTVLMEMHLEE